MNYRIIKSLHNHQSPQAQAGFTLVELIVVMAIMSLMLFFSFPLWKPLVIKTKVGAAASEMQRAISAISSNHSTVQSATPYSNTDTKELAAVLSGSSIFRVTTSTGEDKAITVTHELGASDALVKMESGTLVAAGDSAQITLEKVNSGACPGFIAALQNSVEEITVNGVEVKTAGTGAGAGARTYNASSAANACTGLDTNTFVITFR